MQKEIICTVCPRGCHIMVTGDEKSVQSLDGYGCKRGMDYATSEFISPVKQYDVMISDICGSGADIVATKDVL